MSRPEVLVVANVTDADAGYVGERLEQRGFVPVDSEDEHLVPTGPWPRFHVDVVAPPADARVLARNACGVQAFLLPGVLAVQFHPEVRPATLDDWARRFQARAREPSARAAAYALVDAFLDRVPGSQVVAARSESRP